MPNKKAVDFLFHLANILFNFSIIITVGNLHL